MATAPSRLISGVEAIRAGEKLRQSQGRREAWPYEYVYAPPEAERVHQVSTIACPAANTQKVVTSFTVPANMRFWLTHLVQLYLGGSSSFLPGDGNVTWVLDINIPLGITTYNGYPVQGFASLGVPFGGFQNGVFAPYPLAKPELLNPLDLLQSKVTVLPGILGGRFLSIFAGWLVPA